MFRSAGRLIYNPYGGMNAKGLERRSVEPWWMILKCREGVAEYYQWWIKKLYDVQFDKLAWGCHISVNSGIIPPRKSAWGKYQGEIIPFKYTNNIYRVNNWFFCIDIRSKRLEEIRAELLLPPLPIEGFHMTIARANKEYILKQQHLSEYITDYETIINDPL